MRLRLSVLFCSVMLIILAAATPAAAGQFSFGFSFGYPGCPAVGYFGYYSPPPYVYRVYAPPVVYSVPPVRPYYYAPYRYRPVPACRPYHGKPYKGKRHGAYVPRRHYRH